eukprot:1828781-Lingulodinium_polyedra.AAC.1
MNRLPCHEPRERGTDYACARATNRLHPCPCHMRGRNAISALGSHENGLEHKRRRPAPTGAGR